jgi:acetyl esterase/lipase
VTGACSAGDEHADPVLSIVSYQSVMDLDVSEPAQVLSYGSDPLQFAEFWPAVTGEPAQALILLVHGGCWLNAFDLTHARPLAAALASNGYDVWSLEYRRTGDAGGGWPGSLDDVIEGARLLLDRSSTRPAILIGHSAGGHLALLTAERTSVDGVIGLAAITDVTRYASGSNSCQQATYAFMGGMPAERSAEYAAADLGNRPLNVPVHLLHGEADEIVPTPHAGLPGAKSTLQPGAGHFDWIHPDSAAFATLLAALREMSTP